MKGKRKSGQKDKLSTVIRALNEHALYFTVVSLSATPATPNPSYFDGYQRGRTVVQGISGIGEIDSANKTPLSPL